MRLSKDAYFMNLARAAAARATCPRRAVGAVLVRQGLIVATGYNGAPPNLEHCFDRGCISQSGNCVNTIHAEINALLRATQQGDTLYCTDTPCNSCLKAALSHNPDITVKWWRQYNDIERDQFIHLHQLESSIPWIGEDTIREMLSETPLRGGERAA